MVSPGMIPRVGCSTLYSIKGRITNKQRMPQAHRVCAQRSIASKEESHCGFDFRPSAYLVLNALQHQRKNHGNLQVDFDFTPTRCSTLYSIKGRITSGIYSPIQGVGMCSTLGSIKGRITDSHLRRAQVCRKVLNAL